jgi:hypothetical protein
MTGGQTTVHWGVWVAFFKQPLLPGEAPQTKKNWGGGGLGQAVHQAVSKKRPKPPKLDIPFCEHFWVNKSLSMMCLAGKDMD